MKILCSNCYQETEIDDDRIGAELYAWYKKHRTRIGNSYCKIDHIGKASDRQRQQRKDAIGGEK